MQLTTDSSRSITQDRRRSSTSKQKMRTQGKGSDLYLLLQSSSKSSVHGNLVNQFARSATMQTRSFSVVGPTTWNELPIDLRHLPNGAYSRFHHVLKTVLFHLACVGSASEQESLRGTI